MGIEPGGTLFSFCPGKATWDRETMSTYHLLTIASETGALYLTGGLVDQPDWFVDLLGWFLPRYNDRQFYSRAKAIFGDGSAPGVNP